MLYFIFINSFLCFSLLGIGAQHDHLYQRLLRETQEHKRHLADIGLAERAEKIDITCFDNAGFDLSGVDLAPFEKRASIPQEVLSFDPMVKNTVITADPKAPCNNIEDLKKILDIRLYPTLKKLVNNLSVDVFLGTQQEMIAYYNACSVQILFSFNIPSSAIYYLAESQHGESFIIMAGLVSKENVIAQLITLKLAGRAVDDVSIIGDFTHLRELVNHDIETLFERYPELSLSRIALIVAGCGMKDVASKIIFKEFGQRLKDPICFDGAILSLTYVPAVSLHVDGFLCLDLPYGEIIKDALSSLLERFRCGYLFSGGAAGYVGGMGQKDCPKIGDRVSIAQVMHSDGMVAKLHACDLMFPRDKVRGMHLHVATIFQETFAWLERAKLTGSSVDVETFYIVQAIQDYNKKNPKIKVRADCGCFISDYVGERPLREYAQAYTKYEESFCRFLRDIERNP